MWSQILMSFFSIAIELTVLFIGISFLVSVIQGFIPYKKIEKHLIKTNFFTGAFIAVFFAFITPFCSCSTIPVIINLLNKKVRFAFVMTFLFASPVLDLTIISLMVVLLGFKVAISYTIATIIFSILIGFLLEKLGYEAQVKQVVMKGSSQHSSKRFDLKASLKETLELMKTVYPFLMIGAAIGAIIHGAVPEDFIVTYLGDDKWWLIPVAAIVGIPLYIRLSTMIPISHIMIAKGMALGPVMALMIASAGASLPEIALLNSIFKRRLVVAFISSVLLMSTLSGFLFLII